MIQRLAAVGDRLKQWRAGGSGSVGGSPGALAKVLANGLPRQGSVGRSEGIIQDWGCCHCRESTLAASW